MMKLEGYEYGIEDGKEAQNQGPPEVVPVHSEMKCKECGKLIIGQAVKTPDGEVYHDACYKCPNCKEPMAKKKYGMMKGEKWCIDCISKRADDIGDVSLQSGPKVQKGKVYMGELKKLQDKGKDAKPIDLSSKGAAHSHMFLKGGKDRLCARCNQVIKGPGIAAPQDRQYHKYCLDCDECKQICPPNKIKIIKDRKFCPSCASKWVSG
jgi:cysteine/glycine-rich protein